MIELKAMPISYQQVSITAKKFLSKKTTQRGLSIYFFVVTLLISCVLLSTPASGQTVEFIVHSQEALADTENVFIAGNHPSLGNWNPSAIKLQRRTEGAWHGRFTFPKGALVEFKLTLGAWESEALDDQGRTPQNSRLIAQQDTMVMILVPKWKRAPKTKSKVTGNVRYHKQFHSAKLGNDRDVIVWLPPEYENENSRRYPVLYAHDGQNLFDPSTAFAGVEWAVDEAADSLIRKGKIEPIIVVGIANTLDRMNEYTTVKGKDYASFIIEELKPFIDANYRTLPDRDHTAVMGSSLGGLISFYLAWENPQVFSMAACLSGSWMWDNDAVFRLIEDDTTAAPDVKFYIDHGSEGEEGSDAWIYRTMRDTLIGRGFVLGKNLVYNFGIGDAHDESAWARRVWRPLVFFFAKE